MARATNLMYKMAARAKELADAPMRALRTVYADAEGYDGNRTHDSRGEIVETLLTTEFEDAFECLDEELK